MRVLPVILAGFFAMAAAACGPTAEVTTSPSPVPIGSNLPTTGPTSAPTGAPSAGGSDTPMPASSSPATSGQPTGAGFQVIAAFQASTAFEIDDVTATPNGFMAVGFGGLDGDDFFGRRQGIVWTSADGVNWTETADASLRNVSPYRIVARGAEYFLAGYLSVCPQLSEDECTDVPESGNGIWRSSDGVTWQLLPQLVDIQYGLVDDLLVAGDRLILFGSSADENQTTTVWQSTDGATWTSTTNLAGLETISAMTFGNNLLTGFGTRYVPELEDVVLVGASSPDGASYTASNVPQLTGAAIDDVVQGSSGFVGVGYQSSDVLDIGGVAVASADGISWTEATNSDGSWSGSGVEFIGALPDGGYVAVGFTPQADDFTLSDGMTWHSTDGADWTALGGLEGAFSQLMAATLGGPGMVVFSVVQTEDDEGNVTSTIHGWFGPIGGLSG